MRYAHSREKDSTATPNFHGAGIIGTDGREVPITEEMVSQSLFALHDQWQRARAGSSVQG